VTLPLGNTSENGELFFLMAIFRGRSFTASLDVDDWGVSE
jgi:hypothetical protein